MSMVKRWLTPQQWQTKISPRIFFWKIQHVHGQKMIDPPAMTDQDLILEFFLKIQHVHGHMMIDTPPGMTDQDLT